MSDATASGGQPMQSGVELDLDDEFRLVAIVSCASCQQVTTFSGEVLQPGATLFCPCGELEVRIPSEGFDEVLASVAAIQGDLGRLDDWANAEEPDDDGDGEGEPSLKLELPSAE